MKKLLASALMAFASAASLAEPPLADNELLEGANSYQNKDYIKAKERFENAASHGSIKAEVMLGTMYAEGVGVTKDNQQAMVWFRKAAERNDADAQNMMGYLFINGNGVIQDYKQALFWYHKSADSGNAEGQFRLGSMYMAGLGVNKDENAAVELWKKSAENGNANACLMMGAIYFDGSYGVTQDYIEAYKWFNIASANGAPFAAAQRNITKKKLSPEQIQIAQQRASDWMKAHSN